MKVFLKQIVLLAILLFCEQTLLQASNAVSRGAPSIEPFSEQIKVSATVRPFVSEIAKKEKFNLKNFIAAHYGKIILTAITVTAFCVMGAKISHCNKKITKLKNQRTGYIESIIELNKEIEEFKKQLEKLKSDTNVVKKQFNSPSSDHTSLEYPELGGNLYSPSNNLIYA